MKISQVIHSIEEKFPLSYQEDWDHSGLQIGNINCECEKALICLNLDKNTLNQAIENNCNLIITHHPFMFHPIHTIDLNTTKGYIISELIKNNITVYSMHTNYDYLGMNQMLLKQLNCENIRELESFKLVGIGDFKSSISFDKLIELLKKTFKISSVRVVGNPKPLIHTISLCAGSGHDYMIEALKDSEVYITGDLTYTHAMNIIDMQEGCVIDIPHFVEHFFKEDIKNYIDVNYVIASEDDYFKYY